MREKVKAANKELTKKEAFKDLLSYIRPGFAEKFLDLLLTTACFDFKISFDGIDLSALQSDEQKRLGLISKRLNSLNIENEDNYKEHGIKTFGFGFPLLVKPSKQDPKKIIKAPLFIWQLEIIKATNKVNTWSILRNIHLSNDSKHSSNDCTLLSNDRRQLSKDCSLSHASSLVMFDL